MNITKNVEYFVVMPHSGRSAPLRQLVDDTLQAGGMRPVEESIEAGTLFTDVVQQAIERADFIIADLTESNPNVMYEVGFAHALRKPVLFIVQEGSGYIPHDIRGNLFIAYNLSNPDELRSKIQTWTKLYLPGNYREKSA